MLRFFLYNLKQVELFIKKVYNVIIKLKNSNNLIKQ